MSISGGTLGGPTALSPSIKQIGAASGTWAASEATNSKGLIVIKWTWTSTGANPNAAISAVPPKLGPGLYTVVSTVTDYNGASATAPAWSFTVGVPGTPKPVIGVVCLRPMRPPGRLR